MSQFAQLNTKSVAESVSEQLQHLVLGGGLKPGEKLPSERALSAEFNVSRMSLRQGIALLVDMGLLVVHKDGTYVCDVISPSLVEPFSHLFSWYPRAFNDMLDLHLLLETEAVKLTIERSCESDTRIIRFFYERMQQAFETEQPSAVMSAVNEFHLSMIDCCYNLAIATVLRGIFSLLRSSYDQSADMSRLSEFQFIQERLYQALVDRDAELADQMVASHIEILKALYQPENLEPYTKSATETVEQKSSNSFQIDKTIARIEHLIICGHYETDRAMPKAQIIADDIGEANDIVEMALELMQQRGLLAYDGKQLFASVKEAQPLINDPLVHLMNTDTRVAYGVLELRILLEKSSAAQAANNEAPDKRNYLKECLNKLLAEENEYNPNSNAIDDYEFHLAIADMSENLAISYLMRGLFNLLRASISNWLALFNKEIGDISIIQRQHIDICAAILGSKPETASEAMCAHLQYVITTMQSIYARKEREMYAQQRLRYLDNKYKINTKPAKNN